MPTTSCWLVVLLVGALVSLAWIWQRSQHLRSRTVAARIARLLKPRSPDDCPRCCQQVTLVDRSPPDPSVTPWREFKSRRGAPKPIATQGFACPNHACGYYRITDAQVHALVGDGTHGKCERIQTLRCQACDTTFGTRRDTPLYRLKTASQRVSEVLMALAEGLSIAAAARVFGHQHATITTWLTRAGEHSACLHDRVFRNLDLPHIQFDELRSRLRSHASTFWLWVALDPIGKLIPVLHLAPRTQDGAHAVVHDLHRRLAPDCLPIFTSDDLNQYFYALTAHFGHRVRAVGRRTRQWQVTAGLLYGQVQKRYRRRPLVGVRYVLRCGTRAALRTALQGLGLSGRLNTAFVERANLTLRQSVAALIRRTWSTKKDAPQLLVHLEWWRAYYHFVRPHESLRQALAQPRERGGKRMAQRYRQRTPAMAAGLTRRRWAIRDLLAFPLAAGMLSAT